MRLGSRGGRHELQRQGDIRILVIVHRRRTVSVRPERYRIVPQPGLLAPIDRLAVGQFLEIHRFGISAATPLTAAERQCSSRNRHE